MTLVWSDSDDGWVDPYGTYGAFDLPPSDTVACWHFATSDTPLVDVVASITLTLGTTSSGSYAGAGRTLRAKGYCTARYTYMAAPVLPALQLSNVTIEAIVTLNRGHMAYTTPSSGVGPLVTCAGVSGVATVDNTLYSLCNNYYGARLGWWHQYGSTSHAILDATYMAGLLEPHYLVGTREGLNIGLWIDGELVHTGALANPPSGGSNAFLAIGAHPHSSSANVPAACWHSVAITGYARTDIRERWEAGLGRYAGA